MYAISPSVLNQILNGGSPDVAATGMSTTDEFGMPYAVTYINEINNWWPPEKTLGKRNLLFVIGR